MKNQKHSIVSLLLLQVFLMTTANAFSFSGPELDLDSGPGEYLESHQNKYAVHFDEFSSGTDFRLISEDENDLNAAQPATPFLPENLEVPAKASIFSGFQLNTKQLLKAQIFPFHFFW